MINSIKVRTPILALILFVFAVGYSVAEVVVIPLAGEQGEPGKAEISGYEIVFATKSVNPSQAGRRSVSVPCPEGKKVLGGGGDSGSASC